MKVTIIFLQRTINIKIKRVVYYKLGTALLHEKHFKNYVQSQGDTIF